jgi:hypothetical protein
MLTSSLMDHILMWTKRRITGVKTFGLCLVLAPLLFSQGPRVDDLLRKTGVRVDLATDRVPASREFRIALLTAGTSAGSPPSTLLITQIDRNEPPPRQRSSEINSDHLVVAVLDRLQTVRYSRIITDPRLIRGEFPDASGNLHKTIAYRSNVELSIAVPAGIDASELRIFTPEWDSLGELKLTPLASMKLKTGVLQ